MLDNLCLKLNLKLNPEKGGCHFWNGNTAFEMEFALFCILTTRLLAIAYSLKVIVYSNVGIITYNILYVNQTLGQIYWKVFKCKYFSSGQIQLQIHSTVNVFKYKGFQLQIK